MHGPKSRGSIAVVRTCICVSVHTAQHVRVRTNMHVHTYTCVCTSFVILYFQLFKVVVQHLQAALEGLPYTVLYLYLLLFLHLFLQQKKKNPIHNANKQWTYKNMFISHVHSICDYVHVNDNYYMYIYHGHHWAKKACPSSERCPISEVYFAHKSGPQTLSWLEREVSLFQRFILHTKVYYWDLKNCPD